MSFPLGSHATVSDDLKVLNAVIAHDPAALAILYDRYAPVCYTLILRIVEDEQSTSDIVQRLFIGVWNQTLHYDENRTIGGWLVSVARHEALLWLRATSSAKLIGTIPPRTSSPSDSIAVL